MRRNLERPDLRHIAIEEMTKEELILLAESLHVTLRLRTMDDFDGNYQAFSRWKSQAGNKRHHATQQLHYVLIQEGNGSDVEALFWLQLEVHEATRAIDMVLETGETDVEKRLEMFNQVRAEVSRKRHMLQCEAVIRGVLYIDEEREMRKLNAHMNKLETEISILNKQVDGKQVKALKDALRVLLQSDPTLRNRITSHTQALYLVDLGNSV